MHGPAQAHPSSQSEHPLRTGGNVNSGFGNLTDVHLLVAQATSSKWSFADAAQNLFTHRMSGIPFQNDWQRFLGELGILFHHVLIIYIYNYNRLYVNLYTVLYNYIENCIALLEHIQPPTRMPSCSNHLVGRLHHQGGTDAPAVGDLRWGTTGGIIPQMEFQLTYN